MDYTYDLNHTILRKSDNYTSINFRIKMLFECCMRALFVCII